jgi:5'-3' exonuclease
VTYRVLLDTSSLAYRAFFSIPPSVRTDDGTPVNALHGYLDMVATLVRTRRPDEVVHTYDDDWRPAPRVALYAGYKANRLPDPEGLPEQFVMLRQVLDAMGQRQALARGWEAEDAIGSMVAGASGDDRFEIVTGDRDLTQLVRDPFVRVLFTLRGVTNLRVLDEAGVLEHFGVPADRYAEFAILRGDPSDGLPGVRGVGEKTAKSLIQEYPNLTALVEDATSPKRTGRTLQRSASLRAAIRDSADYLATMEQVARIKSDLDVETWKPDPDPDRIEKLADRWRVKSPIRRLTEATEDALRNGRQGTSGSG